MEAAESYLCDRCRIGRPERQWRVRRYVRDARRRRRRIPDELRGLMDEYDIRGMSILEGEDLGQVPPD